MEDLKVKSELSKEVKHIYRKSFPLFERIPLFFFKRGKKNNKADTLAFYDKDKFVGIAFYVLNKDLVYLFFLAINKPQRGKGYGSRILKQFISMFPNKRVILAIEEIDDKYKDIEKRKRRLHFYQNNGFNLVGDKSCEFGIRFDLMGYKCKTNQQEYYDLLRSFYGKLYANLILRNI